MKLKPALATIVVVTSCGVAALGGAGAANLDPLDGWTLVCTQNGESWEVPPGAGYTVCVTCNGASAPPGTSQGHDMCEGCRGNCLQITY